MQDDKSATSRNGMRSVLTTLRILEEIAARQPIGVSGLSRVLDMPKTSVQRAVHTLGEAGWLRTTGMEPTRWQISYKALTVGLAGVTASGLQEVAHEEMRVVRDTTNETVHLGVPEDNELVVISRLDGTLPLRTFLQLGTRAPLHASASGRAMLAAMIDAEIDGVLRMGIRRYTDSTMVERVQILDEINRTRERGYALNRGEWRQGIGAVGAVVLGRERRPIAGLSVSMPLARYDRADIPELADLLMTAARRIGQLSNT